MKKILIVINTLSIGGAERLVVDQVNYLEKLGHQADILTILPRTKQGFYNNLKFSKGKLLGLDVQGFSLYGVISIRKIIIQGKYDLVVSHLFLANTLTRLAYILSFSRAKMIIYEHNTYNKEKKFKHLFLDWILSFFTYKIIAVSETVKDYLIDKKIPKHKIVLVRNGISVEFSKKMPNPWETRHSLGYGENSILIVSSGNVSEQKGYETLIEAAERIVLKNKNVHFLICGLDTSKYALSLKNKISKSKIKENFHFLGSRLDATEIVNCADIFIMTSLWEGLSISLLEALVMGKIIIVSNIPSLTALIEDRHNGLVFQVGNHKELSNLIMDIMNDFSKYDQYKEQARITGNKFSIEENIKKILSLAD